MVVENVTDTNDLTYLSAQQRLTTKDGKAYYKEKQKHQKNGGNFGNKNQILTIS